MGEQDELFKRKLIERYISGNATDQELMAFFGLIKADQIDELIEGYMDQDIMALMAESAVTRKRSRWPYVAAASILLIISAGSYFLLQNHSSNNIQTAQVLKDLKPGINGAILTLANGQKVVLEKTKIGTISAGVKKSNDSLLTYENSEAIGYNTLETPKGHQYSVVLPDGSKVWLNAASSLKYPTKFTKERLVELTGEAYFEVVHNAQMPFRVKTNNQITEDIGTEFNINSYADEPATVTTLVEGAIKVNDKLLKPGQAAKLTANGTVQVGKGDVEGATAWKNGLFNFEGMPIAQGMRQIARWYDVEIEYPEGMPNIVFHGDMHRNSNAAQVLEILTYSKVHFQIVQGSNGKKILVKP